MSDDNFGRWGLAAYRVDDPMHRDLVERARDALDRGKPHTLDEDLVLVGEDLVYLPEQQVGSVGSLYVPSSGVLIALGSYTDLDNFLWAYHRGVDLVGETKWDRSNSLTIHAVHDGDTCFGLLQKVLRSHPRAEIRKGLERLPWVIEDVDLYFSIPQLRTLESSGCCELTIGSGPVSRVPDEIRFYSASGEYGELSNFKRYPVVVDEKKWPTSEHYFQAQKFLDPKDQEEVRTAKTSMIAARIGRDRRRKLRKDWESVKDSVMRKAVEAKFRQHDYLRELLLATGNAKLVEHTSNDAYWGDGGDGSGRNMLGRVLMQVRAVLAEEAAG